MTDSEKSLLSAFSDDILLVERLSRLTAQTYCFSVKEFLLYLDSQNLTIEQCDHQTLLYYLVYRHTQGFSELTLAKDISSLHAFGSFLHRRGIWRENYSLELDRPKAKRLLPHVLSVEQVDALLGAVDTSKPLGVRDRSLYELIYSCGLRISEASSLLVANVHFDEQIVIVRGKGDKERIVPFGEDARLWMEKWLFEARPSVLGKKNEEHVYVNFRGQPLSRKGIWKNFQELEAKAGVSAKVHTLRHSFATHLLAGGADLRSVQELLGHADLSTTQIYTHIDDEQLKEYHAGYFPGHKK